MKLATLNLFVLVCIVLFVVQTVFIVIPIDAVRLYNMALRPLVYATLAVIVYVFLGLDKRPVRKAHDSNAIAIVSVAMFGVVIIATAFLFGAGTNVMTQDLSVVLRNLWERGLIVILGELVRYKLIKNTGEKDRSFVVIVLTIVLAYGQMNAARLLVHSDVLVWAIFFESIFRPLVISAVASYFAMRGSFLSVIMISFTYIMVPYLSPILPDISPIVWSLIISGLVFITAVIYNFATNEKSRSMRIREKRAERYAKKPLLSFAITAAMLGVIVAFFAGAFPIYPVVVLTGSMSPTFNRGSLVFVERVPTGEAFTRVGEGYVIHFENHNGVNYIHRVIDFRHTIDGERQYVTQGDAAELIDPFPVSQDNVLGIARASLPFFGYPYIFFRAILNAF